MRLFAGYEDVYKGGSKERLKVIRRVDIVNRAAERLKVRLNPKPKPEAKVRIKPKAQLSLQRAQDVIHITYCVSTFRKQRFFLSIQIKGNDFFPAFPADHYRYTQADVI